MSAISYADFLPAPTNPVHNDSYEPRLLPKEPVGSAWFVGLGGGIDSLYFCGLTSSLITVQSFPGFPPGPADTFTLSSDTESSGFYTASAGYRWKITDTRFISAFFEYDHLGTVSPTGTRLAFGIPAYASTYSFNVKRQAYLFGVKVDVMRWKDLLPYIEAGMGVSQNTFSNFQNNVVDNVIFPFPNNTNTQFSCIAGFGVDLAAAQNWLLGLGYRFGYWGQYQSGEMTNANAQPVAPLPAPVKLESSMFSNQVQLKVSYLFST